MRTNKIKVFYNPKQVLKADTSRNFSKSPLKPALLLEHLNVAGLGQHLSIDGTFRPYQPNDFKLAHQDAYIYGFFEGNSQYCNSNGLEWTPQFAESFRYTNASLYEAIRNSVINPDEVSFSPTSGFHHARPTGGSGYCTFSGQVIASVKMWRKYGKSGCYLDLDGHTGNSIEDSRTFQPDLYMAVPVGFNFNTHEQGTRYVSALRNFVQNRLEPAIVAGKIDYVVWCHGADSHEDDDLGNQCSTEDWFECSKFFWSWVKEMDEKLGRSLPVSCALFGGYRSDDYNSVLSLHAGDLMECMNLLLDLNVHYVPAVKKRERQLWNDDDSYNLVSSNNSASVTQYKPISKFKYRSLKERVDDIRMSDTTMMQEYRRRLYGDI